MNTASITILITKLILSLAQYIIFFIFTLLNEKLIMKRNYEYNLDPQFREALSSYNFQMKNVRISRAQPAFYLAITED